MTWISDRTSVLLYGNSRHAAGDGVDLRSRVTREPRRSGMPQR